MRVRILFADTKRPFYMYEKYLPLVSAERRKKIERYRFDNLKTMALFTELIIRSEAVKAFGIKNSEIVFGYGEYGKPYIINVPDYHFSVSHSGNCIAFASAYSAVGVDAEKLREGRNAVAKRFFTKHEYEYITESREPDTEFFRIWTAKEAYVKMLGTGLATSFGSFDVINGVDGCSIKTKLLPEYAVSVCVDSAECDSMEIEDMDYSSILNVLL